MNKSPTTIMATLLTAAVTLLLCQRDVRAAGIHAENYDDALTRAKKTGQDIVVLQRGSDWNKLGEMLYNDIWLKDEFARQLGTGFILVAVDRPDPAMDSSPSRLASLVDAKTLLPANEVIAVESEAKIPFSPRPDGAFLGKMKPNPDKDTLTLKLTSKRGGRLLRLDFPADPSLPTTGPGRASNGNFCISEIVVRNASKQLTVNTAWSNSGRPEQGAWRAIDGIADKTDNFWNALANNSHRTILFLLLKEALQPGETISIQLFCLSGSKQHIPGCVRAASLNDTSTEAAVRSGAEAEQVGALNAKFSWWDTSICPRIALLDNQGRGVACENKPRLGLTPATMAARVKELRSVREKRDALWARAEKTSGPEKAELLRQGLDVMGFANWVGNDKCYAPIHDKIREADPKDESGAVRWLSFGKDPRDGFTWAEPRWSKALESKTPTDADFIEALTRIDKELKDPRNKALDHERLQRIMIAKYLVYSRWPKHEEQRFDVQREIAALDPNTFWGIGAIGDLAIHHLTATPMLSYGWGVPQVKPGLNVWNMTDTAYRFDHAGPYTIRFIPKKAKDALKIRRIALLKGTTVLTEAGPATNLVSGTMAAELALDLKSWKADSPLVLRVEAETVDGGTNTMGTFAVEPQLLTAPALAKKVAATDDISRMLERGEILALQQKLSDTLMAEAAKNGAGVGRAVEAPAMLSCLAQYSVIRLCGADKVASIATRDGGTLFLQSFFKDTTWMEAFLASKKTAWPQALENLYLLRRYGTGWEKPFNQRLATALALQWGKGSPYQLVDRFEHIQRALREGLMHSSFETLDMRELCWSVNTHGTAKDYQFLLDDRQTRLRDYLGAHGGIRYVSFNVYGVSVQTGWDYLAPWEHVYGGRFLIHKQVGGVCGAVSSYGAATAQAHGIPSTTIGQPGHCAYVVRVGQEWPVGNSVTWPSSITTPGWDGTSYATLNRLYEPVIQERERFMVATRLSWLAQVQVESKKGVSDWSKTFEQAILVQPTNYGTWLEYIKLLETIKELPDTTWRDLGLRAARTFSAYNDAGWALTRRCLDKALPTMKPADRMSVLLACNKELRQDNWYKPDSFPYDGILNWQAERMGDPALAVELFGKLLAIHHSDNPNNNFIFGNVMSWGAKRFAGNPKTAPAYAKAMETFFTSNGKDLNKNQIATTLQSSIKMSSQAGDIVSFTLWADMAEKMLPPLKPGDVYLNAKQAAAFPKILPFPGDVLSADGMLQTSSAHTDDKPLAYRQLMTGGFGGWFDTASDKKPWAQVQLLGEGELEGIILVGRYEYPANHKSYKEAPLKISVSLDNKTWTEVASFDKDEIVFRVDLQKRDLKARYVRAERVPVAADAKPFERFSLRGFFVYGKKLY
ncbi:MAG: discoidin domain-containing protein [bacterium]